MSQKIVAITFSMLTFGLNFFAGSVECFYTTDSIYIYWLYWCTNVPLPVMCNTVTAFSSVMLEVGQ
jgi:hypothetical protein